MAGGILTSLCLANILSHGIHWNFVVAAAVSVLSVFSNARFAIGTSRQNTTWYGLSIALWLLAVSTYSIQSGAIISIFLIALTVPGERRILTAAADVLPHAIVLLVFDLIWKTTDNVGVSGVPFSFSLAGILAALRESVWNFSFATIFRWVRELSYAQAALFLIIPALVTGYVLRVAVGQQSLDGWIDERAIMRTAMAGVGIVAPTVVLESGGLMWLPGTRIPMVMQFWTPILILVMWTILTSTIKIARLRRGVWICGVATCAGCFAVAFAGMDFIQVRQTQFEKAYFKAIEKVVMEDAGSGEASPLQYVVKVPPGALAPTDWVRTPYVRTLFPQATFSFINLLPEGNRFPVIVENGEVTSYSNEGKQVTPLANVTFLEWDGNKSMWKIDANPSTFSGYSLQFK